MKQWVKPEHSLIRCLESAPCHRIWFLIRWNFDQKNHKKPVKDFEWQRFLLEWSKVMQIHLERGKLASHKRVTSGRVSLVGRFWEFTSCQVYHSGSKFHMCFRGRFIVSSFHHLARQCALTVWNRWHRLLCMMHGPQTGFTTVTINYKLHICEYSWQFDWKWISCKCCDVLESKLFPYGEESRESWMLYMGHPIILDLVLDSPAKSAIAILSVLFQIYLELKALEIAAKHLSQLDEMRDDLVSVALSLGDFGGWGSLLAFWDGNAWVT